MVGGELWSAEHNVRMSILVRDELWSEGHYCRIGIFVEGSF